MFSRLFTCVEQFQFPWLVLPPEAHPHALSSADELVAVVSSGFHLLPGGFPAVSLSAWWSSPWWSYLKILFPLLWFQTKLVHQHWERGSQPPP